MPFNVYIGMPQDLACILEEIACSIYFPDIKEFRNDDLQTNEMGQSTELTPLVSLLFGHS